jgi:hypothetical protein
LFWSKVAFEPLQQFDNFVCYNSRCAYDWLNQFYLVAPLLLLIILFVFASLMAVNSYYGALLFVQRRHHTWIKENSIALYASFEEFLLNIIHFQNGAYYFFLLFIGNVFFSLNNIGLLPYAPTLTSQLIFVLAFSFIFIASLWADLVVKKNFFFCNTFCQLGYPF